MTDHIANVNLGEMFGRVFARVPLVTAPNIRHADALEIDWADVLPPDRCRYVLGNPPFVGAKMQSEAQRAQVRRIARLGGSGGTLDYVAAWFLKAGGYVQGGDARIAFVATNSICQGEQVAQLWPKLFNEHRLEIAFGHRTFAWPGRAAVHCVIVGLMQRGDEPAKKRLFSYADPKVKPIMSEVDAIGPYLFAVGTADRHKFVKEEPRPINSASRIVIGSKPIDGGYLIVTPSERHQFDDELTVLNLLRPYIGTEEFLNGSTRWILALQGAEPGIIRKHEAIRERLARVRRYRRGDIAAKGKSKKKEVGESARSLADVPTAYHVTVIPEVPYLAIPENSSERRNYIPIGWLEPPAIPSNKIRLMSEATLWHFGILTSGMHMAWMREIGGRLESRYQYSIGIVYNTFPWPDAGAGQRAKIENLAQAVLDARALPKNATSTLSDLYDPDFMPAELRKAHRELDAAVDKLYAPKGFADDRARVEHLFRLYERLVLPTAGAAVKNRRVSRRTGVVTDVKGGVLA